MLQPKSNLSEHVGVGGRLRKRLRKQLVQFVGGLCFSAHKNKNNHPSIAERGCEIRGGVESVWTRCGDMDGLVTTTQMFVDYLWVNVQPFGRAIGANFVASAPQTTQTDDGGISPVNKMWPLGLEEPPPPCMFSSSSSQHLAPTVQCDVRWLKMKFGTLRQQTRNWSVFVCRYRCYLVQ